MAIHFSENHKKQFLEGFQKRSETEDLFTHELDVEFSGVRTVHVKSIKTEKLQDYNRNLDVTTGSRYGAAKEVGDEEQTFTMTQDKSLNLTIDKGNNVEQFNMKQAGKVMKAHRDEQIIPTVDTYRLAKWAKDGGIHFELDAETTKENVVAQILELHNMVLDAGIPENGCVLLVKRQYIPALKLAPEWAGLDTLGGKTLPKGSIGEFDGMPLKPITNSRFPAGASFMILYKGAVISPVKIDTFKGHVDPPGLSGDQLEFRMLYDAFVLGKRADGVAVGCMPGTVTAAPEIAIAGGKATITAAAGTVYYTTDGSDPRYSVEAKTYTAAVAVAAGDVVRAYAAADGKWNSAVTEATAE